MPDAADFARPKAGINPLLAYGQSLSSGWEGWPALSGDPVVGTLMLGASVRPVSESEPVWDPTGDRKFRPLIATVQDLMTGAILPPETVAGLRPGDPALGETVLEGAVSQWRKMSAAPADQYLLCSSCGVGGRSLEELSKGAEPELFNRLRSCVRAARDVSFSWGMSYGVLALLFLQGENNSLANRGTSDRTAYMVLIDRFYRDFVADIAIATGRQRVPPAMFMYQTGGNYAAPDNAIAQAQLDFAMANDNCFLAAPSYPVCDKGGHLEPDGYRWLGAQFGKVMHRVFDLGQNWMPLHPCRALRTGREIRVSFHVPVPPLAWGKPFSGKSEVDVPDNGFSIEDVDGTVPVASVVLKGADTVVITVARDISVEATVKYAAASTWGMGGLHDSDNELALHAFVGVPTMAGQPYPLHNWSVAFALPIEVG
jgi:hypothetical protein